MSEMGSGINVFVRIRPLSKAEASKYQQPAFTAVGDTVVVLRDPSYPDTGASRTWDFSQVFGPTSTQEEVYDHCVSPVIADVINGYNCTVFAYGQTGTGKTFTMEGERKPDVAWKDEPNAGMIPRAVYQLFSELSSKSEPGPDPNVVLTVSYIELYNENLYDLLYEGSGERPKLQMFDNPDNRGSLVIKNLSSYECKTKEEVIALLDRGAAARRKTATKLNSRSSRSHALFMISVFSMSKQESEIGGLGSRPSMQSQVGKLNLVDLAGSESVGRSGAVDAHAREAGCINKSLLALRMVIMNLATDTGGHIPYRSSKLTRLLQDSLGGKTKTTLIAAISPVNEHLEESVSTLDYACKAKSIVNNPVSLKHHWKKQSIAEYLVRIEQCKSLLEATRREHGVYMSPEQFQQWQQQYDDVLVREDKVRRELLEEERAEKADAELQRRAEERLAALTARLDKLVLAENEARVTALQQINTRQVMKERAERIQEASKITAADAEVLAKERSRLQGVNQRSTKAFQTSCPEFERNFDTIMNLEQNHIDVNATSADITDMETEVRKVARVVKLPESGASNVVQQQLSLGTNPGRILEQMNSNASVAKHDTLLSAAFSERNPVADIVEECVRPLWNKADENVSGARQLFAKEESLRMATMVHGVLSQSASTEEQKMKVLNDFLHALRAQRAQLLDDMEQTKALRQSVLQTFQGQRAAQEKRKYDLSTFMRTISECSAVATKTLQTECNALTTEAKAVGDEAVGKLFESVNQREAACKDLEPAACSRLINEARVAIVDGTEALRKESKDEMHRAAEVRQEAETAVIQEFSCAEMHRWAIVKSLQEWARAEQTKDRESAEKIEAFVRRVVCQWFEQAPEEAEYLFTSADTGLVGMTTALEYLFSLVPSSSSPATSGQTPVRRRTQPSHPSLLGDLAPLTPKEALVRRHQQMIASAQRLAQPFELDSQLMENKENLMNMSGISTSTEDSVVSQGSLQGGNLRARAMNNAMHLKRRRFP
ncbi:unnamed protein product [Notodromas monacha]|uniref:Kinesin motor domain-containing protein n=1 Tax=Notodromas monacha TaxID=399045 RepID=A0A7R9BHM2_9CRUS|nr:unnamed protein product [Notodromas monacha]CAG0914830.1 unnamed protein product [Notodromas monacha]